MKIVEKEFVSYRFDKHPRVPMKQQPFFYNILETYTQFYYSGL